MAEKYIEPGIWNRRTHPRYDFRVGISLKSANPQIRTWETGVSQNLSQDGINILHSKILVPDEIVHIAIPIFSSQKKIMLTGTVTWVAVDDLYDDSSYWVRAGIMFHDMEMEQRETIINILFDRQIDNGLALRKVANRIDFVM